MPVTVKNVTVKKTREEVRIRAFLDQYGQYLGSSDRGLSGVKYQTEKVMPDGEFQTLARNEFVINYCFDFVKF